MFFNMVLVLTHNKWVKSKSNMGAHNSLIYDEPNSVRIGFDPAMETCQDDSNDNLYVSVKLTCLYCGLKIILV